MYVCECGREFDNPQKFNGHKQGCEVHIKIKYGTLDAYYKIKNRNHNKGNIVHMRSVLNKELQLQKWVAEQHRCEKCGKIMTDKYGSGRFCCKSCANSRVRTEEQKEKVRKSVLLYLDLHGNTTKCSVCGKKIRKTKYGMCSSCFYDNYPSEIRERISKSNKGRSRWNIHRNQTSYAESFWENVLQNNGIEYIREFQIKKSDNKHCYYMDFLLTINNTKIDLEIDGIQHLEKDRASSDIERDAYLNSVGYIVYRVLWNEISSTQGKNSMKSKIEDFLSFYKEQLSNNT